MNKFRFIKVRDVKSPSRGNKGDAGLDFYIPEDLTLQDLVKANPQLIFHCEIPEPGKVTLEYIHVPIYLTEPEEVTHEKFYNDAQYWGTRGNNGFGSTN